MIKTKFVFAVSFVAIMAVSAANAEIASVSYTDKAITEKTGDISTLATTAKSNLTAAVNELAGKVGTQDVGAQVSAALDSAKDYTDALADGAVATNTAAIAALDNTYATDTALTDGLALKQDKLGYTAENAANRWTNTENYNTVLEDATKYPNMPVVNQMISDSAADATAQINSVNSKVTALTTTVAGKQATLTTAQLNAANSGVTSAKVGDYDDHIADGDIHVTADQKTAWSAKQNALSTAQLNAVNSGVTSTTVSQVATNKTNIATNTSDIAALETAVAGKQATLTTSNIKGSGSVSVGISDGVITVSGTDNNTTYSTGTASTSGLTKLYTGTGTNTDGTMTQSALKTALDGKQATLTTAQLNAANSGITSAKVGDYDDHIADGDIHVTADQKTAWSAKQNALSTAQLNAVNSGVTSTTVSQVATNKTNIATNTSDIAALETAVAGKQATLTTSNIKGSGSVSVGISDGVITVSGTDNNTTYSTGTASTSGLTKLYTGTGTNTDGTMTQSALKTALDGKLSTSGTAAKATADASGNTITSTYEKVANKVTSVESYNEDIESTTKFPTMAVAQDMASQAAASAVASKLNKNLGSSAATKAVITDGSGNVTYGTISSGMITDGTVALADLASNSVNSAKIVDASIATADIADGAVTTAKIAASAVTSAKIADGAVATADIAAGAVTAAKTTGIYGFIPSGSEGASTTAASWVE